MRIKSYPIWNSAHVWQYVILLYISYIVGLYTGVQIFPSLWIWWTKLFSYFHRIHPTSFLLHFLVFKSYVLFKKINLSLKASFDQVVVFWFLQFSFQSFNLGFFLAFSSFFRPVFFFLMNHFIMIRDVQLLISWGFAWGIRFFLSFFWFNS